MEKINDSLNFIFARVNVTAILITQYTKEEKTSCVKHFSWYKCDKIVINKPRPLNEIELNSVLEATKIKAYEEILTKLNEFL